MRTKLLLLFLFTRLLVVAQPATPDRLFGELFVDVQTSSIFSDSKVFVDAIPVKDPASILAAYRASGISSQDSLALLNFVRANFILPRHAPAVSSSGKNIFVHIETLWDQLQREKDSLIKGSSLLPLPYPYVVPGGRFREIYYWDSYFTMLGLKESGRLDLMQSMLDNFAYLIDSYGHIPNGNRSYYLSRSQPPFFSMMVELLASAKGDSIYLRYLPALQKEYAYWNDSRGMDPGFQNSRSQLNFFDKGMHQVIVNRYWDEDSIPRQESYREDILTARKSGRHGPDIYRNLRAAAASGWDFSSRWFDDKQSIETIHTLDIVPVDLNCLLFHLKQTLYKAISLQKSAAIPNDSSTAIAGKLSAVNYPYVVSMMRDHAKQQFRTLFFNDELGWYTDFDLRTKQKMKNPTLAGMFPLFFKLATREDAGRIAAYLEKYFLKEGGLVTSLENTGQQWDAPNGWPPLQWIAIIGLENYGFHVLAREIAERWVKLNAAVYKRTGKLMEKYNVINLTLESGGGEYPAQDGFGWTNGVFLALVKKYNIKVD